MALCFDLAFRLYLSRLCRLLALARLSHTFHTSTTTHTTPKVKLYDNARDRKTFSELADLYAIFKATEHLEVAYARDAITKDAYTDAW